MKASIRGKYMRKKQRVYMCMYNMYIQHQNTMAGEFLAMGNVNLKQ
jgi:hypothetical protein